MPQTDECIFCKIIKGELPSTKVFENDRVLAIRDIAPQAPVHIVVMPKQHIRNLIESVSARNGIMENIVDAVADIAAAEGIDQTGFRLINNNGPHAGQTVEHLHFHLLGGGELTVTLG